MPAPQPSCEQHRMADGRSFTKVIVSGVDGTLPSVSMVAFDI